MMPRYWIDVMPVQITSSHEYYGQFQEERIRVVVWDTETGHEVMDVTNAHGKHDYLSNAELRQMAAWKVKKLVETRLIDERE